MPAFLQEPFNLLKTKGFKGYPFLYFGITFISLLFIDLWFKYVNFGFMFDSDIIHILLIDLVFASIIMLILIIAPVYLRKYILFSILFIFVIMALMYSLIGFDGLVVENIYSSNLYEELGLRIRETFNWKHILFIIPLLVIFSPFKITYTKIKYASMILVLLLSSVVGTLYLDATKYNNDLEVTTNLEKIIYNDEGTLLFNRLGSNIGFMRSFFNDYEYNLESNVNLLGQTDAYLEEEVMSWNNYKGIYEDKNLIVVEVPGLDYIAVQSSVMPTLVAILQEGLTFTNYYDDSVDSNFEILTGLYPDSSSLNNTAEYAQNSYPQALGNQFLKMNYETSYVERERMTFEYENNFIARAGFFNIQDSSDYSPNLMSNLELVQVSLPNLIENRFYVHYKLTGLESEPTDYSVQGNDYSDIDAPEVLKKYYSYASEIDMSIKSILEVLAAEGQFENTVIMVVSSGRPLYIEDEVIREYVNGREEFTIDRVPFVIWDGYKEEIITEHMGDINIAPTLFNMFDFKGDPEYIGVDVFESGNNVVELRNRSWVSNAGYYNAYTQKFLISDSIYRTDYLDEYIMNVNKNLYFDHLYSRIILEKNYFIQFKV